jgi:hypothetical protein
MKIARTFMGTVSGGVLSAACFGILAWIVVYFSDPGTGTGSRNAAWAHGAAMMGAVVGLLMGLLLGFILGLLNGGLVIGTLSGFIGGMLLTALLLSNGQSHPDIFFPIAFFVSFIPAGALSGFLTSLIILLWGPND